MLYVAACARWLFVRHGRAKDVSLMTFAFEPTGDFKRPLWGDYITQPSVVATPFGRIMELPLILAATCDCNASLYYLWDARGRRWQRLDFEAWKRQLETRVPAGLQDMNSAWPDLAAMTVDGTLWRSEDAHCCPTGGSYHALLSISNGRFVLKSVRIVR